MAQEQGVLTQQPPAYLEDLGNVLWDLDRRAAAVRFLQQSQHQYPGDFWINFELGTQLAEDTQTLADAVGFLRVALAARPNSPPVWNNLAGALARQGKLEEAVDAFHKVIALQPDRPHHYFNLGKAYQDQKKPAEAVEAYRQALARWPDFPEANYNLAVALHDSGKPSEALAALAGYCKAMTPQMRDRPEVRRKLADAYYTMAGSLAKAGKAEQAIHRFWEEAVSAQPGLTAAGPSVHRYNAACAAALAGCGKGKDAAPLDASERARWRNKALDWLRAELAAWRQQLADNANNARSAVRQQMEHWQRDPDFAGVRGNEALATLPESERLAWQQLWAQVEETLARAEKQTTPEH
jgi:tetratricopeptide (TPR) repeat protein